MGEAPEIMIFFIGTNMKPSPLAHPTYKFIRLSSHISLKYFREIPMTTSGGFPMFENHLVAPRRHSMEHKAFEQGSAQAVAQAHRVSWQNKILEGPVFYLHRNIWWQWIILADILVANHVRTGC